MKELKYKQIEIQADKCILKNESFAAE